MGLHLTGHHMAHKQCGLGSTPIDTHMQCGLGSTPINIVSRNQTGRVWLRKTKTHVQCGLQYLDLQFSPQLLPHVLPLLLPLCLRRLHSFIVLFLHRAQLGLEVLRQTVAQRLEEEEREENTTTEPAFSY